MIKRLTRVGNSHALFIDKAIMNILNITPDTPLKIRIDNDRLIIEPRSFSSNDHKLEGAYKVLLEKHEGLLKRLASTE